MVEGHAVKLLPHFGKAQDSLHNVSVAGDDVAEWLPHALKAIAGLQPVPSAWFSCPRNDQVAGFDICGDTQQTQIVDRGRAGRKLGSIAGAVRVNRAAVREASKAFEGLLNDSMRRRLTQLSHKAYTAGVVLFLPIESCPWGALQFGTTSLILKGLSREAGAQRTPLPHALYSACGW